MEVLTMDLAEWFEIKESLDKEFIEKCKAAALQSTVFAYILLCSRIFVQL